MSVLFSQGFVFDGKAFKKVSKYEYVHIETNKF